MDQPELHPDVRVGHVHLRVADLDGAVGFYRDVLGFDVVAYGPDFGLPGAAFLSAGGYHHHIGLNTWTSGGGTPPPGGHTGLYHFALLYPGSRELARAVRRLLDRDHPIDGAEDHGATVSVYLRDPDGNGIELYYDRPRERWFDARGIPVLKAEPLDPRDLPADAEPRPPVEASLDQRSQENGVRLRRPRSRDKERHMQAREGRIFIGPDDGTHLPVLDIIHKVSPASSGGSLMIEEWKLPPGEMIPPHTHAREDECSFVLEGELTCDVGGEIVVAPAGSYIVKPRGISHAFYNAGTDTVRVMEILTPGGGFEGYFDEYERILSSALYEDERRRARAELGGRYGIVWHDERIPETEARFGIRDRDDGASG